ncbi:hypothetical protein SBF1_1590003 [Candidatus Desulfosporosinus infrequens]|uniref:Uncharacterized protein n=1 Tax=Candidatus Desulfosporosinus infrequens TaxID=2043169 RepID=A0A2U3K8Z4_9FIRM|nr:hypothetical protein SBF1_1590003 [Candidatus Desulfosporosinus infrequens]
MSFRYSYIENVRGQEDRHRQERCSNEINAFPRLIVRGRFLYLINNDYLVCVSGNSAKGTNRSKQKVWLSGIWITKVLLHYVLY